MIINGVNVGGGSGSLGTGIVTDNAALAFSRAGGITVNNVISGSGGISQNSSAARSPSADANTYIGATLVNHGTMIFTQRNSLANGNAGGNEWDASALNVAGARVAQLKVASGATLQLNVGGAGEFAAGDIDTLLSPSDAGTAGSSVGGFASGATLALDTSNAGGVANVNGIFDPTYTNAAGNGVTNSLNLSKLGAGILAINGPVSYTGTTNLGTGTIQYSSGTLTGNISGAGNLEKATGGFLTLSGTNTNTGHTTVTGGILDFANRASLYNGAPAARSNTNILVGSGGTLALGVGGGAGFTSADVDTIRGMLTSATGGFQANANLGFDTTNAAPSLLNTADHEFVYASGISDSIPAVPGPSIPWPDQAGRGHPDFDGGQHLYRCNPCQCGHPANRQRRRDRVFDAHRNGGQPDGI